MIKDFAHRFKYHPPQNSAIQAKHETIRTLLFEVADEIDRSVPEGREKSLAITKLEEAMFWANAAIARDTEVEGVDYVLNGDGERVRIR